MDSPAHHSTENPKKRVNLLTVLLAIGFIGGILLVISFWLTPQPQHIQPASIGSRSLSLAWLTKRPTKGCVIAYSSAGVNVLIERFQSYFRRNYKGRYVVKQCEEEKASAHLVNVSALHAETSYSLILTQGLRKYKVRSVLTDTAKTAEVVETMPELPLPAYGKVLDSSGNPASGVLVYVYSRLTDKPRFPVASVTNTSGNYAIDLSNLVDPKLSYRVSGYVIEAFSPIGEKGRGEFEQGMHSPFPTITLSLETNGR